MIVHVTHITHTAGSTVTVASGQIVPQPRDRRGRFRSGRIRFAGDWRAMENIADALSQGRRVDADVEDWQVLG